MTHTSYDDATARDHFADPPQRRLGALGIIRNSADAVLMHTGDGRLWLRFTATTLGDNVPGPAGPATNN
ncbi:hypothetical protein ABZS96_44575 [Streptomyces avermitilis]|uniref:hypothetical protein n=1 Tax=Streptomyces avermitilis TaxID=33903 RepID=UPI00339E48CA